MNERLSARQTAANNATILTQLTLEAYINAEEKIDKKKVNDLWKEYANAIFEWIMQDMKEDPFIMIYIDKKKGGKDPSEYDDIFTKHGFKKTEKGGYYARLRQHEWNEILQRYEWLPKAVEIKTEIAKKQEEEK